MRTRQIQHLRPEEILPELEKTPVAYVPLGLIEWHGPHLPLGTDALNAEAVALRAAEQSGGLVMPALYVGTERERPPEALGWIGFGRDEWIVGMNFPANPLPSMYAAEEVFALVVREHLRLIAHMGFKIIVLVTGHAATNQIETLKRLAGEFNAAGEVQVLVELPFAANDKGTYEVGHASRIETAVMLALAPKSVRLEALPALPEKLRNLEWAIVDHPTFLGQPTPDRTVRDDDDPRRATAEDGKRTVQRATAQIAEKVKAALARLMG